MNDPVLITFLLVFFVPVFVFLALIIDGYLKKQKKSSAFIKNCMRCNRSLLSLDILPNDLCADCDLITQTEKQAQTETEQKKVVANVEIIQSHTEINELTYKKTKNKFCSNCGQGISHGAIFCHNCGKQLSEIEHISERKTQSNSVIALLTGFILNLVGNKMTDLAGNDALIKMLGSGIGITGSLLVFYSIYRGTRWIWLKIMNKKRS